MTEKEPQNEPKPVGTTSAQTAPKQPTNPPAADNGGTGDEDDDDGRGVPAVPDKK